MWDHQLNKRLIEIGIDIYIIRIILNRKVQLERIFIIKIIMRVVLEGNKVAGEVEVWVEVVV